MPLDWQRSAVGGEWVAYGPPVVIKRTRWQQSDLGMPIIGRVWLRNGRWYAIGSEFDSLVEVESVEAGKLHVEAVWALAQ